jgi:hypothetical protein
MSNITNMEQEKTAKWTPLPRKLQWYGSYVKKYAVAMSVLEREIYKVLEQTRVEVKNILD